MYSMTKNLTLLILSLLLFQVKAKAQKDTSTSVNDAAFVPTEQMPSFSKGGASGFMNYLWKNIKFPTYDIENHVQGKVMVTFVVEKDGTLSDVKVLTSPDKYIGKAVVDVVKTSPPWNPGMQNGLPVRIQFTIPFKFDLSQ